MTNTQSLHRICLMAGEDAAREILELRERNEHLEIETGTLRAIVRESLHEVRRLTLLYQRERFQRWILRESDPVRRQKYQDNLNRVYDGLREFQPKRKPTKRERRAA